MSKSPGTAAASLITQDAGRKAFPFCFRGNFTDIEALNVW